EVELELYALQAGRERHLDRLIDAVEQMRRLAEALTSRLAPDALGVDPTGLSARVARFERHVSALAVTCDPELVQFHHHQTLTVAGELRRDMFTIDRRLNEQVHIGQ